MNVEDKAFHCRASQRCATYHMLTALSTVNRFPGIPLPRIAKARDIPHAHSTLYREQISMHRSLGPRADFKAVGTCPPTAGLRVNKQKWRKKFQNKVCTHVCRPNTCPTYGAELSCSSRPSMELVGPRFRRSGERLRPALAAPEPVRVSQKSRLRRVRDQSSQVWRASCRFASVTMIGLAMYPRGHHRDVCGDAGHSAKAGWPAGYSPLGSHSAPGELLTTFLTLAAKWHPPG